MDKFPHGDFVFYGDESGEPTVKSVSAEYPVFILSFCGFLKQEYITDVMKHMKGFKFAFWGHDMAILHSRTIRSQVDRFSFLKHSQIRELFMSQLSSAIENSPFTIISAGIDKRLLPKNHSQAVDLYELCLTSCLKRIYQFLEEKKQQGKVTYLVIESRMVNEDKTLERAFRNVLEKNATLQSLYPVRLVFADKRVNSIGLQMADLIAYPIGRYMTDPKEKNASFEIVKKKLHHFPDYLGKGLEIVPNEPKPEPDKKAKTSDFSEV